MSSNRCPVEGCEYGESDDKSKAAVRSHVNAKSDPEHNWADLKSAVMGDPDADETDDADGEQTETDENEENEEDEDDMPTDEEYQEQHAQDDNDTTDDTDTTDSDTATDDDAGGGGFSIPALDGSTVMLVMGLLAVLVVAYLVLGGDGSVDQAAPVEEDTTDSAADSSEEVSLIE